MVHSESIYIECHHAKQKWTTSITIQWSFYILISYVQGVKLNTGIATASIGHIYINTAKRDLSNKWFIINLKIK